MRGRRGAHIVEFAAAICILVCLIVLPLIDLAVIPIRWMLAQELVNDYSRRLALAESFSQAYERLAADPSLRKRLVKLGGVEVNRVSLRMRVARAAAQAGEEAIFTSPKDFQAAWLPDGSKAPCSYSLEVFVDSSMSPLILLPGPSVPGLTRPLPIVVAASHNWGNLGRNPRTGKFFLNE